MKKLIALLVYVSCVFSVFGMKLEKMPKEKRAQALSEFIGGLKEAKEPHFVQRGLLIFKDDSETDKVGAMSQGLFSAVAQEAGPIITSTNLLKNIFSEYEKVKKEVGKAEDIEELKLLNTQFQRRDQESPDGISLQKYVLLKASRYNPSRWIIKYITDSLCLLLPQAYLDAHSIIIDPGSAKIDDKKNISATELELGLKVDHMDTKTIEDILKQPNKTHDDAGYFVKALVDGDIFCTRSEYFENKKTEIPLWTIYQTGHGGMQVEDAKTGMITKQGHITNLTLPDFKKELNFFEPNLNIKLFVYSTCFGAGVNTEIAYKRDEKNAKSLGQRTFSFPIITQATTDAPTAAVNVGIEVKEGELKLDTTQYFDKFLKTAETDARYEDIIQHLFSVVPGDMGILWQKWGNAPQIKFPGIEWFSIMATHKYVASIGSVLAKTRDPNKPFDVTKFFGTIDPKTRKVKEATDLKALLLYARDIPFELVINAPNMDAIVSMVPGDAIHKIKKVSSTYYNETYGRGHGIETILGWFMKVQMLGTDKIFFIEEISGTEEGRLKKDVKDVIVYNKVTPAPNRFSDPTQNYYAFYTEQDGKRFVFFTKDTSFGATTEGPEALTPAHITLYESLLAKVQGKVQELGTLSVEYMTGFGRSRLVGVPKLNTSCTIEKILGKDTYLLWIFDGIKEALSPESIASIGEITGWSGKHVPDTESKNVVTIQDVVIEKKGEPYYTYNGKFYRGKTEVPDYREEYKKRLISGSAQKVEWSLLPSQLTPEGVKELETFLDKKAAKKHVAVLPEEKLSEALNMLSQKLDTLAKKLGEI